MERISLDDWYANYEPVEQDDGDGLLLSEVPATDRESLDWYAEKRLLWTQFSDDETIRPGYHHINVLRYLTTAYPYESPDIIVQNFVEVPERKLKDIYYLLRDCPKEEIYDNVVEVLEEMQEWLNL